MSKMSPKDALKEIYRTLTDEVVGDGEECCCKGGSHTNLAKQNGWSELFFEFRSFPAGGISINVFWVRTADSSTTRSCIFRIGIGSDQPETWISLPDFDLYAKQLDTNHCRTLVWAQIIVQYHRLVNGSDDVQPTRDEQVVLELAGSAKNPDSIPGYKDHKIC